MRLRLLSVDPIKAKDSITIALKQLKLSCQYLPSSSIRLRLLSVDPINAKDSITIALEQLKLSGQPPPSPPPPICKSECSTHTVESSVGDPDP